jgi:hypothetical protein
VTTLAPPRSSAYLGRQNDKVAKLAKKRTAGGETDNVTQLVSDLSHALREAVDEIEAINANAKLLSLNARIEAARAGEIGAAFAVVAQEMQNLAGRTSEVASGLTTETQQTINELLELIGTKIRGTRLSDIALTNIDLIDRCLYERTCDVRWWATDSSVVDALTLATDESRQHACQRMGVILGAYTVYFDLVLCDNEGNIVANGRPDLYRSIGRNVANQEWFAQAMGSRTGDEFGFQTAHHCSLVNNEPALVYSCSVREGGISTKETIGVLGIIFKWEALAQTILKQVPLSEAERKQTRCAIVDSRGRILADSWDLQLQENLSVPDMQTLFAEKKNFAKIMYNDKNSCFAHARAPGFETYCTGWHSVIIQSLEA